jgi:hypothetical protein
LFEENDGLIENFERNFSTPSVGLVDYDGLNGSEIIKLFGVNKDRLTDLIRLHSSVDYDHSFYVQHNEMGSHQIGEMEYQIDVCDHSDLKEIMIGYLTSAEAAAIGYKDRETIMAYGRPCERLILKLDANDFLAAVAEVLGPEKV